MPDLASLGYHVVQGLGNAVAGEPEWLFRPTGTDIVKNSYGIVACHWHQSATVGDGMISPIGPAQASVVAQLCRAGFPVIAGALGFDAYGNDTSLADVTALGAYMSSRFGTHPTKWIMLGTSMGGLTALRYAALNPANTVAALTCIPLTNLLYTYSNNVAALGPAIGTAWGVTYPAALPGAGDTQSVLPPLLAASKVPVKMFYSSVDTLVRPVDTTGFATAVGASATAQAIDSTYGHADATNSELPMAQIISWLQSLEP